MSIWRNSLNRFTSTNSSLFRGSSQSDKFRFAILCWMHRPYYKSIAPNDWLVLSKQLNCNLIYHSQEGLKYFCSFKSFTLFREQRLRNSKSLDKAAFVQWYFVLYQLRKLRFWKSRIFIWWRFLLVKQDYLAL